MTFKILDTETIKKALENETDILTPAAQAQSQFYSNVECPCCQSSDLTSELNKASMSELLPRYYFECRSCGCKFDPHSSIIHRDGIVKTPKIDPNQEDLDIIRIDDLAPGHPPNDKQ